MTKTKERKGKIDKELNFWRYKAHQVIDMTWKSGIIKRKEMYLMLKKELGTVPHISESSIEECKQIIAIFNPELVKDYKKLKTL